MPPAASPPSFNNPSSHPRFGEPPRGSWGASTGRRPVWWQERGQAQNLNHDQRIGPPDQASPQRCLAPGPSRTKVRQHEAEGDIGEEGKPGHQREWGSVRQAQNTEKRGRSCAGVRADPCGLLRAQPGQRAAVHHEPLAGDVRGLLAIRQEQDGPGDLRWPAHPPKRGAAA